MTRDRLSVGDEYKILRGFGMRRSAARVQALVTAIRLDESDRVASGLSYSRDEVRVAIVHGRQDLVAVIAHLGEVHRTLRSIRRWLIVLALIGIAAVLSLT